MPNKKMNTEQPNTDNLFPLIEDVSTIEGLMKAFYEVVSGEAGEVRQWKRDASLHNSKAIYSYYSMINGESKQLTLSLKDFQKETDLMVLETPFYENEINREVKIFGNIANVWSTYETRLEKGGEVVRRGINSLQLFYANNKWEIISLVFDKETERNKIPQTFKASCNFKIKKIRSRLLPSGFSTVKQLKNYRIASSCMQVFIIWYVRSISLSSPIEKRIKPSVNPISACSSIGISLDVEVPGALNNVL